MNSKKYLIASFAAGTWIFLYGFIVNALLLRDFWTTHGNLALMRSEGQEIMWAITLSCYLQGFVLACIYAKGYENKGITEGLRFGLLIAVFVAALYLLFYGLQPWGATTILASVLVDGLMYIGAGVVLAALYKP